MISLVTMTKNKANNKGNPPKKHREIATALREARDSLSISLKQAALDTRIDIKRLEQFEAGIFDIHETYTRGQLNSYAKHLGLNPDVLTKLESDESQADVNLSRRYKRARSFVASNSIVAALLVGALLVVSVAVAWLIISYFSAPRLEVYSPDQDGIVTAYSVLVEGETSSGSDVFVNGEPVLVDLEGAFTHRVLLREGLNEIQIRAVNSLSREAVEERIIIADFPNTIP